jgi:hypothetical protein
VLDRKLEKELLSAIRNFQLAIDLLPTPGSSQTSTSDESHSYSASNIEFRDWFDVTIVRTYGLKMPDTVKMLCNKLELDMTQIERIAD